MTRTGPPVRAPPGVCAAWQADAMTRARVAVAALLLAPVVGLGACTDPGTPRRAAPLPAEPSVATAPADTDAPDAGSAARSDAGSDAGDATAGPGAPGGGTAAESAYLAWLGALAARDAAGACARQAPELTIELRGRAILLGRAGLGDPCTGFVGVLWDEPTETLETDVAGLEVTSATAERTVLAADLPGRDQTVTMTYDDARWRVLATVARGGGAVDDAVTARWVAAWCDLEPGSPSGVVVDLMGEPSGRYTVADGGEPQLYWAAAPYDFRAYLDTTGRVLDLVGDYDALTARDRARLPCPELR